MCITMCDCVWAWVYMGCVCVSVGCVCGVWSIYVNVFVVYVVCGMQHTYVVHVYGVKWKVKLKDQEAWS